MPVRFKGVIWGVLAVSVLMLLCRPETVISESTQVIDVVTLLTCQGNETLCGPRSVNCTFGDRGDTWVEITNVANYTQYGGALSVSDVPDPIPPPYSLSATDFAAPANAGTCFSRSPGVPSNCTENCLYYPEIFGYEWLLFGTLFCSGTCPKSESDSSSGSNLEAVSEPGVVTAVLTKQCKDYNYEPPWMAVVTDQWGGKWALQTSESPMETDEDWANNLESVVWPDGWTWENVTLTESEIHVPYLYGETCWSFIIRDNNQNAWHMFEYPKEIDDSLFANIDCVPFMLSNIEAISSALAAAPYAEDNAESSGM